MQFKVDNMTCSHCMHTITRAIKRIDPQAVVNVDLGKREVGVTGLVVATEAIAAMGEEGYRAFQLDDE